MTLILIDLHLPNMNLPWPHVTYNYGQKPDRLVILNDSLANRDIEIRLRGTRTGSSLDGSREVWAIAVQEDSTSFFSYNYPPTQQG